MILETVMIVADALVDPTIGLATWLATVPLESGDSAPTMPTIYNEVEDGEASRDVMPEGDGPFLMISSGTAGDRNPSTRPISDASVDILIRYLIRDTDTARAIRTASYAERAVRKVLGLLGGNDGAALRLRNQMYVIEISDIRFMILSTPTNDRGVSWGLTCACRTRDLWAVS